MTNRPLYQQIVDDLLQQIRLGDFSFEEPLATEKALCKKYDVSRITASRALDELEQAGVLYRKRGMGSFVIPSYQEALNEHAHDYKIIALVIPFNISEGGMITAIETASSRLFKHKYFFTLHICDLDYEKEYETLEMLSQQNIDGLVYYPTTSKIPVEILQTFVEQKKPVIILDKKVNHLMFSNIISENYKGSYQLTEHLLDYDHVKTCYLSRFPLGFLPTIDQRYQGYAQCLADREIAAPPRFIVWEEHKENNYSMLKYQINALHREGVTAILCENDEMAFHVNMCCESLAILVPEQMNITGFDNTSWATMGSAQITTMDQNFDNMGDAIADIILNKSAKTVHKNIPVALIPRRSTSKRIF